MRALRIGIIPCLLLLSLLIRANDTSRHKMKSLFGQAEQCYLTDDFEQLKSCMDQYYQLFKQSEYQLGDSMDVYYAYYCKIAGDYYYGLTQTNDYYARLAERFYRTSLHTFFMRNSDHNVITLHEELAQLYYKTRDYDRALLQLDTVFTYYDKLLNDLNILSCEPDYYRTLSQLAICNARVGRFDQALQQITTAQKYFKQQKSEFYFEMLRRQGKILMMQADSIGTDRYKEAVKCYERYVDEEFTSIYQRLDTMTANHRAQHWLATHRFLYDCYRLGNHAPEMLYNLALFSKGFLLSYESNKRSPLVRWEQVRRKLTSNDCAIEFVQYFGHHDEKRMGCLVLHHTGKPQFIDLFDTDSLLSLRLTPLMTVGDALDVSTPEIKDALYLDSRLINIIWSPRLMETIGDVKKVYFAPDGLIHQWAIEYLIPDSQKVCYRLSSTRSLIRRNTE